MPAPVHLQRMDPVRGIRRWGRIGTEGQEKIETFTHEGEAYAARARLACQKVRHDYAPVVAPPIVDARRGVYS